jgi:hypothetical protein
MKRSMTSSGECAMTTSSESASIAAGALAAVILSGMLVAGCGKSEERTAAAAKKAEAAAAAKVTQAADEAAAAESRKYEHMANAVVTSKSTAAVDLKYDVLVKPEVGQTFDVELDFLARLPADSLEVELGDMPGLTIVGERSLKFTGVGTHEPQKARVQVRADAAGLYYLRVVAKMITQVQTESRAFSVPVVVGTAPAAAQKPAPQQDSTGQAIEPMPAQEG